MKTENKKTSPTKLLMALVVVLLVIIVVLTAILLWPKGDPDNTGDPAATLPPVNTGGNSNPEEDPGVPLATNYIVLSYPSELEDMVSVHYEDLEDGQQITFTTDFTGEELELFRFSISKSGTDGYQLGVLKDEQAGDLLVCMHVKQYSNGSWTPEEFAKLNAMQERVNDIIIQFHADPRFEAAR